MTDPQVEQMLDLGLPAEVDSMPVSSPRDAWVDSNEPVSLPEPGHLVPTDLVSGQLQICIGERMLQGWNALGLVSRKPLLLLEVLLKSLFVVITG